MFFKFLYIYIFILLLFFTIFIFIAFFIRFKNDLNINNISGNFFFYQKKFYSLIYPKDFYTNSLKKSKYVLNKKNSGIIYVINFNPDVKAIDIFNLKRIVSLIISVSTPNDFVFLKLTSSGGFVNNYGLAALEFERFKKAGIKLVVSIDFIAASGGFLIACVADEIIASEFAIIGSIGVLGIVPNFNRLLKKNYIDVEQHFAGDYKTTLNFFVKNTDSGRNKFIDKLNDTHCIFKKFVKKHRNILDDSVFNGDYWYGIDAIKLNLIDKVQTSEEFIFENIYKKRVYEITFNDKNTLSSKIKF